jgi:hypothetical protein
MSAQDERLAEELFRRVRRESPREGVRRRVLSAMLAEPATPSFFVRARIALLASARVPASLKLIGAVTFAGAAVLLIVAARQEQPADLSVQAEPPRAPSTLLTPRKSAATMPEPPVTPSARPSATPEPAPRHRAAPERLRSPAKAPDLGEEIAMLDRARKALGSGDASGALALLDAHSASGAKRLGAEATLLRIEALVRAGRRAEARALAERFVAANPTSALAERAQRLAGLAGEAGDGG